MNNDIKKAMQHADQSHCIANKGVFENNQIHLNNNTKSCNLSTNIHTKILSLIGAGEENAIHLCDLMSLTGLGNREVRKSIETLRRNGTVIISNSNGYFQPLRSYEVDRYIKQESGRAKSIFYTLKAARMWKESRV